jgi:NADH dehydrogenase/NADH:ubiquinone oxidoreductase subunit G
MELVHGMQIAGKMAAFGAIIIRKFDLCPVGALLDKDFLFQQRVWFLKKTPSIDGITASGDNISVEHNDGRVYRIKPRVNEAVNKWWITDEVRYGWKFVHSESRIRMPRVKGMDILEVERAWQAMFDLTHTSGEQKILLEAIACVDCALWDLVGKARGKSVRDSILAGHSH